MVVLYIILRPLSGIDAHLFADTVLNVGFAQQGIPFVFFVGQDRLDHAGLPYGLTHRCGNAAFGQFIGDLLEAPARQEAVINQPNGFCLFGINLRLSILAFTVAEEGFIREGHISFLCTPSFAPRHIMVDIFRFALGDRAVDGDVKLRRRIEAVQVLFLKVHIHFDFPQHSGNLDAVECVSSKAANGFDDDHIYFAALALTDQLVEFIPLFHAGTGDTLVGVNACQFPASFSVDALCVISYLIFVAVELFILLGGYPAVSRYSLDDILCAVHIHWLYGRRNGAYPFLQCLLFHLASPFQSADRFLR